MRSPLKAALRRGVARGFALTTPRVAGLRILTYHRVNPDHPRDRLTVHPAAFAEQMELLAGSGRPVVSLTTAARMLGGSGPVQGDPVALTFDDGYQDNLRHAAPVLERLGLPAAIFVVTGLAGTPGTLDRYEGCCDKDGMLSWDEVRALRDAGHEIGGHGREHRELATLPAEAVTAEVESCSVDLERELGARPAHFCYPRGSENDVARRLVGAAGYTSACTVRPGTNRPGVDLLGLRRTEVSGDDSLADFRLKLDGGFDAWHAALQAVRTPRVP